MKAAWSLVPILRSEVPGTYTVQGEEALCSGLMPAFGLCGCLPPAVGPELGVCLQKPLYFLGSK